MTNFSIYLLFGLLICHLQCIQALFIFQTYVKIFAENTRTGQSTTICANQQPRRSDDDLQIFTLNDLADESILCEKEKSYTFSGQILTDGYRINPNWPVPAKKCEREFYLDPLIRIEYAQQANASAMLFRVPKLYANFYVPRFSNSTAIAIPLFYINEYNFAKISELYGHVHSRSKEVQLNVARTEPPLISGAMFIFLIITLICIILGGLWSGYTHRQLHLAAQSKAHRQALGEGQAQAQAGQAQKRSSSTSSEVPAGQFNWCSLACLLIMVVTFLLLFYYLYDYIVWFILILFTIISSFSTFACLDLVWRKIFGDTCDKLQINFAILCECFRALCNTWVENLKWRTNIRKVLLYLLCLSISLFWFVTRKEYYSSIIHAIISVLFCIHAIKNIRLPSFMWVTMVLGSMLIYDLFMVFITPLFTKEGCSIMVEAVTGGSCSNNNTGPPDSSKEEMPIVFRVIDFTNPLLSCYNITVDLQYPQTILGFGDVIVPGLLVGYNFAFDLAWKVNYRLYFLTGVVGYFFGMLATFLALTLMHTAQPALIYLVPFTLIPTHVLALFRQQWWDMWDGKFPDEENLARVSPTSSGSPTNEAKLVTPEDGELLTD